MRRIAPLGLRTRLIAAFLLVAAISAVTTAALTYQQARNAILKQTQDTAVNTLRDQVEQQEIRLPLNQQELQRIVIELGKRGKPHPWIIFGEYGGLRVSTNPDTPNSTVITDSLRTKVRTNQYAAFQRVEDQRGNPWLTIGVPALFEHNGYTEATGVVFYASVPLSTEKQTVEAMVEAAQQGAVPGLAIAIVPALLAARSVLRPVRDMRRAAQPSRSGVPTSSPDSPAPSTRPPAPWSSPCASCRTRRPAPAASPPTSPTNCAPPSPGCSP